MPGIISPWKLRLDPSGTPLVLVDVGGKIGEELRFPWEQQVDDARRFRADGLRRFGRGNTSGGITVQVYDDHADLAAAQSWLLALQVTLQTYSKRSTLLEVTTKSGAVYFLANAVLANAEAVMVTGGVARTLTRYKIDGATWSLGTPATPDPVGLEESLISLARTGALLDAGGAAADDGEGLATWTNVGTADDATQATSGERPAVLRGEGLYHPGTAGNYYSLADDPGVEAGATFSVGWYGVLPDYTPAARVCLIGKWVTTGNQRSYALFLETDGRISLQVSTDGTAAGVTTWTSAFPPGVPNGQFMGVIVSKATTTLSFLLLRTLFDSTGSIVFSPAQTVTNINPFDSTSPVEIGSTDLGTADLLAGYTHGASFVGLFGGTGSATVDFTSDLVYAGPAGTLNRSGTAPARVMYAYGTVKGTGAYPRFDGTADNLEMTAPAALNAVSGVTVIWLGQLNRVTGDNDLVFCGTNSTDPRILLRVDDGDVKLLVRRTDAEATATITAAAAVTQYFDGSIAAVVDYAGGVARIYVNGSAVASGALTSAGSTSATDSSETRIMAGQGGANPAAGDLRHLLVLEEALSPFALADQLTNLSAAS